LLADAKYYVTEVRSEVLEIRREVRVGLADCLETMISCKPPA